MPVEEQDFNKIYGLLVHGEDDLVGQIAYAIYKQQKVEKIQRFISTNGRTPTKKDLTSFLENAASENQCRFYKDRAVVILQDFLKLSLEENLHEIEDHLKEDYDLQIRDILRRTEAKSFMYGVWQSVFASFIFFAAGILLLLATGGWTRIGKALIQLAQ